MLVLLAAGLCMLNARRRRQLVSFWPDTADGFDKETAVSRAQRSLEDYIQQYKAENHLDQVTISAMRAEPQPYWRGRVSENMMHCPDIVTDNSLHGLLARRDLDVSRHLRCPAVLVTTRERIRKGQANCFLVNERHGE
jgi:hypothetical protein